MAIKASLAEHEERLKKQKEEEEAEQQRKLHEQEIKQEEECKKKDELVEDDPITESDPVNTKREKEETPSSIDATVNDTPAPKPASRGRGRPRKSTTKESSSKLKDTTTKLTNDTTTGTTTTNKKSKRGRSRSNSVRSGEKIQVKTEETKEKSSREENDSTEITILDSPYCSPRVAESPVKNNEENKVPFSRMEEEAADDTLVVPDKSGDDVVIQVEGEEDELPDLNETPEECRESLPSIGRRRSSNRTSSLSSPNDRVDDENEVGSRKYRHANRKSLHVDEENKKEEEDDKKPEVEVQETLAFQEELDDEDPPSRFPIDTEDCSPFMSPPSSSSLSKSSTKSSKESPTHSSSSPNTTISSLKKSKIVSKLAKKTGPGRKKIQRRRKSRDEDKRKDNIIDSSETIAKPQVR